MTRLGPRCGAIPSFQPVDTFNTRVPMQMAELVASFAEGKNYAEIGTRKGDIYACAAHYANHSIVVEVQESYCPVMNQRAAKLRADAGHSNIDVRCPAFFDARGVGDGTYRDVDVFYTFMGPDLHWTILHTLRNGVREGTVKPSAILLVAAAPFADVYLQMYGGTVPPKVMRVRERARARRRRPPEYSSST